jgi:hypothetical protein
LAPSLFRWFALAESDECCKQCMRLR